MRGMTRQDPRKMAAWLSKRERHGWSWADLSRRSGLPAWKLRWWHERLQRNPDRQRPAPSIVAVEIADRVRPACTSIEITTPSGYRVEIPPDFDAEHLRRVLQALGPAC
jgi:hypothetical protein